MTQNEFLSVDTLLTEIVTLVSDTDYKKGIPKGRYVSWVKKAIQELAIDTFFFKKTIDVEIPQNLRYNLPKDIFNIRELYLYNGRLCNPDKTENLYWKRLFNNGSSGDGYTAKIKDDGSNSGDIFVPNGYNYRFLDGSYMVKYYFNIENGILMLSKECRSFPYLRIVANTMGGEADDLPVIPRFFEQAVIDFVKVKFYEVMKGRDPRIYRILWADAKNDLENLTTGSWNTAKKRVKSMNTVEKESIEEYISSLIHK